MKLYHCIFKTIAIFSFSLAQIELSKERKVNVVESFIVESESNLSAANEEIEKLVAVDFSNDVSTFDSNNSLENSISYSKKKKDVTALFSLPKIIKVSKRSMDIALETIFQKYPALKEKVDSENIHLNEDIFLSINEIGLF